MNCRTTEHEIQRSLDTPLTTSERARLDAHLAACSACRRAWEEYRRLSRDAAEWAGRPAPSELSPAEFTAGVMAQIERRPVPVSSRSSAWTVLAVTGLLAACSPFVSAWLPPAPQWRPDLAALPGLWVAAQGILAARWAAALLLPALCVNALFVLRLRRAV